MLRGLWRLTWLEIKIFLREPMGVIGTVGVPVVIYVGFSRAFQPRAGRVLPQFVSIDLLIFTSLLLVVSTVLSLVAILAIYREGGILKRLRATPLRPHTVLTAHVIAKLVFTAMTFAVMMLVGRRYAPVLANGLLGSFTLALVLSTVSALALGFLIASVVPTARVAQPIGAAILYPMLAVSGLFVPLESLPPMVQGIARALPFTYAVSLLRGIWHGENWRSHTEDVAMLTLLFAVCVWLSGRVFRWE